MKNNTKMKVTFASLFVGLLALAACNNNTPTSSKKQESQGGVSSQETEGTSRKKSSSTFVFSSVDEATLPDYEVKIVGADDAVISQETVKHGKSLTKPADPTAPAGKKFYGWMNVKNGGQIWDFEAQDLNVVMEDIELKPLFVDDLAPQTFEAELCPAITEDRGGKGMEGATYSGGALGKQLIKRSFGGEYKASGNFIQDEDTGEVRFATDSDDPDYAFGGFVHFMYAKGDTLTWELESDAAAENVTLFARFCGEYAKADDVTGEKKFTLTDDDFQVKVNGEAVKFGKITLHNIPETGNFTTFQDFFMGATFNLAAGTNKVEMVVNNDINLFSTIAAAAPCVDCIKLLSSSNITWPKAKLANLEIG